MLRTRKLHMGMCVGALICIVAVLWAVPSSANTARTTETPPSPLELWGPDQPQGEGSSSTLDFLVVQESGPAVATCRVEIDLEAGMNKVVVQGVPSTVDCGAVELLSGTVPFKVASAAMDRGSGQLVFDVEVEAPAHAVFTAVYPFSGVTWGASYNATLEVEKETAQIWAWYSIRNETDCDLAPSKLLLIAGPDNTLKAQPGFKGDTALGITFATIDSPEPLRAGAERNIRFAGGAQVPARLIYMVDWSQSAATVSDSLAPASDESPVMVGLEFSTSGESGLSSPLPGGRISVFSRSRDGATFFLGEDIVSPCLSDATVMARLGPSTSLTAVRSRTDHRKVGTSSWEDAYQVRIVNDGTVEAAVVNIEEFPGQWSILQSNTPASALVSGRAHLVVSVPAGGQANILFRVRYTL
ncbi:MAG: hypothetical protein PHP20_09160 [Firmicutes bacterium]|nr:hypothetical protein [Bacillota bacterium]MDD4336749.1 hypothetical protein [Bacillota bacterium]MDD4793218.1 hypothetical protein [Bacillota bacterium]